jgi:hypothetical protein
MGIRFSQSYSQIKPQPQQSTLELSLVDAIREINQPLIGTEACAEIEPISTRLERIIPLIPNNPKKLT